MFGDAASAEGQRTLGAVLGHHNLGLRRVSTEPGGGHRLPVHQSTVRIISPPTTFFGQFALHVVQQC